MASMDGLIRVSAVLSLALVLLAGTASAFYPGYAVSSLNPNSVGYTGTLQLPTGASGPYGNDIHTLSIAVEYQTSKRIHVKITDPSSARWEVPGIVISQAPTARAADAEYDFQYTSYPFGFAIVRRSNGEALFNSTPTASQSFNGLVFENQYIELSTQLNGSPNIYGLGERVHEFRLDPNGKTYTLFNRDQATPYDDGKGGKNLYGSHPFYMDVRNGGLSHGVFLLNSNAMDVVLNPTSLTYKVVGGVLDFYVFLGPTPEEVVKQYQEVIGTPVMIPYWALGFHQCRWGYKTVAETWEVVKQYRANNLPLDTMWNDIDHMDRYFDFSLDPTNYALKDMTAFVQDLHNNGQQYMMIVDAGIAIAQGYPAYDLGNSMNVFIMKETENTAVVGKVWPGATHFPDFLHPNASEYWQTSLAQFHSSLVQFDGVWLDMNEVSNFCDGDCASAEHFTEPMQTDPPYVPGGDALLTKTISMGGRHYGTSEYNAHNLFATLETKETHAFLTGALKRRPVIISRASFPGHGRYGSHWLGDNDSTYDSMRQSIAGILSFQLFGIPFVGADICGFNQNTTVELCARWMALGALYPFSRNHNTVGALSQEPYALGSVVLAASQKALNLRYTLLPLYYTLFLDANINGGSVVKPLFFEFPEDASLYGIDQQFLVGSALLVTPVLTQGATSVTGAFPTGVWYDYYTGAAIVNNSTASKSVSLPAAIDHLPLHVRGGFILPLQDPKGALNTKGARTKPYQLLVALSDSGASGSLYWDEGDGLDTISSGKFVVTNYVATVATTSGSLQSTPQSSYAPFSQLHYDSVRILGTKCPTTVA
eukprot:Opistho-2@34981